MPDDKNLPAYRNPETGLLRCPINGFRDCVQEKCFFWTPGDEIVGMYDAFTFPVTDREAKRERHACLLWVLARFSSKIAVGMGELLIPRPATGRPYSTYATELLREIRAKVDVILKRTKKP
jgi:hypothetical protein